MSGFSSQWLEVREPVDFAARSEEVLSAVAYYFGNDQSLRITDIGCGTGSTVRAINTFLSIAPDWHLVDNDAELLELAKKNIGETEPRLSLADLSVSIDVLFENSPNLITTSAFLDLVSRDWLSTFVQNITEQKIPFYAALTYDGRTECTPEHVSDHKILDAFNQHQRTNKGFGPSLGPQAAKTAIDLFKDAGYIVTSARSDWVGDSQHKVFQHMLIEGWHSAACEIEPENAKLFDEWFQDRKELIDTGNSTLEVGHMDFFAVPSEQAS